MLENTSINRRFKEKPSAKLFLAFIVMFIVQAVFSGQWMYGQGQVLMMALAPCLISAYFLLAPAKICPFPTAWIVMVSTILGCGAALISVHQPIAGGIPWGLWLYLAALVLMIWETMDCWARINSPLNPITSFTVGLITPFLFGATLIYLWEMLTVGLEVPKVLLPPPHLIAMAIAKSTPILWDDFQQTFLKAVLAGYLMGCGSGFLAAILVDRIPFFKKGLLPLGNLVSALPVVGVAPIMVMWFGFDWPSKAAVVVIMTFFPMLVNTLTGLTACGQMERDLMHSYAANYWQSLLLLRLPNALPFIFNALKINSTLALIGAIVAEFFGTPIVGMGFRISTEVGRMNIDIVWATITVAALSGSVFYALIALCERRLTAWHPALRH